MLGIQRENPLTTLITTDIKPMDDLRTYRIICEKLNALEGDVSIMFVVGGKNYTVPGKELSVGPLESQGGMCQTVISGGGALNYWGELVEALLLCVGCGWGEISAG